MKQKYNILPNGTVEKRTPNGVFRLEGAKMPVYARSIQEWVLSNPLGVAMTLHHNDMSIEVGTVYDVEWDDSTGAWAVVEHTPEQWQTIQTLGYKRVSGGFVKSFTDYSGRVWELVLQHLSFVHSPQFHAQLPPMAAFTAANQTLCLSATFSVEDLEATPSPTEETMSDENQVVDTTNAEPGARQEAELAAPESRIEDALESASEAVEGVAELNSTVDTELLTEAPSAPSESVSEAFSPLTTEATLSSISERLHSLTETVAALEARLSAAPEAALEAPATEDAKVARMSAQNRVLRETKGKDLGVWSEEELVDASLAVPGIYEKILSTLADSASHSAAEFSNSTSPPTSVLGRKVERKTSKVAGSDLTPPVEKEEAWAAAFSIANERGTDVYEEFEKLTGQIPLYARVFSARQTNG